MPSSCTSKDSFKNSRVRKYFLKQTGTSWFSKFDRGAVTNLMLLSCARPTRVSWTAMTAKTASLRILDLAAATAK